MTDTPQDQSGLNQPGSRAASPATPPTGAAIGRIIPLKVEAGKEAEAAKAPAPQTAAVGGGKTTARPARAKKPRPRSGGYRQVRPELAVEFQPDAVEVEEAPPPRMARYMLYALLACLAFAVTWAYFAEIDRVVSTRGKVVSSSAQTVLQPLEVSLIRHLAVKPGDIVHEGDLLVELDSTFTGADLADLEGKKRSYDAEITRLEAELNGEPYLPSTTPSDDELLQRDLYQRRHASYQAQVASYDEELARGRSQLVGARADIKALMERLKIANEIEAIRAELQKQEVGSKLNLLVATSDRLSINRDLERARNLEIEAEHLVRSAVAKRDAFIENWRQEIAVKLVGIRRDANQVNEQLNKARLREKRVTLRAPEDAIVLATIGRSAGTVVQQGDILVSLVPLNAPVEAEVQITPADIGFLSLGASVRIKLDAYPYAKHGTAEGELVALGNDTVTEKTGEGQPHYMGRVRITKTDLEKVPDNFRLIPGMTLTGEIAIGKRTVFTYILYPLMNSLDTGLKDSSL